VSSVLVDFDAGGSTRLCHTGFADSDGPFEHDRLAEVLGRCSIPKVEIVSADRGGVPLQRSF
jgi:hypothetical protein